MDTQHIINIMDLNKCQTGAFSKITKMIDEQNKLHGIISMATGTGKTRLAVALIIYLIIKGYVKDKAILFLSPRRVINEQNREELERALRKFNLNNNFKVINISNEGEKFTGEESAKASLRSILRYNYSKKIIILTPQLIHSYLQSIQDNNMISTVGTVILDEVHHTYWGEDISKSVRSLLDNIDFVFGFTATPIKEALENVGNILYSYTSNNAMRDGILVNGVKVYSYQTIINGIDDGEAWRVAIKERVEKYADELIKILTGENDKRILKTMVVAANTTEADLLYEQLKHKLLKHGLGESVYIAHSKMNEPLKTIRNFEKGILITVNMADIGFDDRDLEAVVIARPINTPIGYVQIKGRVLRKPTNKDNIKNKYAILIDFTGSSKYESDVERVENGEICKNYSMKDIMSDLYGYGSKGVRSANVMLIKNNVMLIKNEDRNKELHENQNFIKYILLYPNNSNKKSDYAYILDILPNSRSKTVKWVKKGLIIQAIAEDNLKFLELLCVSNRDFEVGERLYIGRDKDKDIFVLGALGYHELTTIAREKNLHKVVYEIVGNNIEGIIREINEIGRGKYYADCFNFYLYKHLSKFNIEKIIRAYEKGPFRDYNDFKNRTGIKLKELLTKSIIEKLKESKHQRKVIISNKNSNKPYQCNICSKRFESEMSVKQHTRDKHGIII